MSTSRLYRWSGLAGVLCGLLLPVPWIMEVVFDLPPSILSMSLDFVAITCIVFALMGIYSIQINESGICGFLGFVLTILMSCIGLTVISWSPQSGEAGSAVDILVMIMGLAGLCGYILLGIGSWKAGKFPRWVAVLWPLGTVISAFGVMAEILHVIGIVVWGLGFIGAGVKLLGGMDQRAT